MVSSLTGALNTANSSIRFNQNALSVVANNVANANTVGYTRQVIQAENLVIGGEGQGVTSGKVVRYFDQNLQNSKDQQNAKVNYNKTISDYFATIENQFGKLTTGDDKTSTNLDRQISDMFTQLNNLIQDPLVSSNRVTFKNSTVQTAQRLNKLSSDLTNTQINIDDQISSDIDSINIALKNISDLNFQIGQIERAQGNSSDLKDLRQNQINELSKYVSIQVEEKQDGYVHVSLESGKVLVDSTYVILDRTSGAPFGGIGFNRVLQDGEKSHTTQELNMEDLETGKLGAMVRLRDKDLPEMVAQLDTFAMTLKEQFNNIHAQGVPVPPPNVLKGVEQPNGAATLLEDIGLKPGTDFNMSIVDADGKAVGTTAQIPYAGSIQASTVANVSTGTFDPAAYLSANGSESTIEGSANIEYLGGGLYRMTDPSGSIHTATLTPAGYPVDPANPAVLDFGNGVSLNVDAGSAEPTVGNIGSIDLKLDSGPIRIEKGDTLQDLADKINSNPALAGKMNAQIVDGSLQIKANNSTHGVIVGNDPTGSTFNKLGFNRYFEGDSASNLKVSDNITGNLNNITTGRMREDGGFTKTNNENAVALSNLQNESFHFAASGGLNAQDATLSNYFISITTKFTSEVTANTQEQKFNETLYNNYDARIQSISGVNTDEEFSNMIIYQRSFEASSKIIKTIDDMMNMLLNMI